MSIYESCSDPLILAFLCPPAGVCLHDSLLSTAYPLWPQQCQSAAHHCKNSSLHSQSHTIFVSVATSNDSFHLPPLLTPSLCFSARVTNTALAKSAKPSETRWFDYFCKSTQITKKLTCEWAGWATYTKGRPTLPAPRRLILRAAGLLLAVDSQ